MSVLFWSEWKDEMARWSGSQTYTGYAMNFASSKGQIAVLEWWKRSGLQLNYTDSKTNIVLSLNQLRLFCLEVEKNSETTTKSYASEQSI